MANKRSYTKFYALLRKNPRIDKDELVLQYTDGRTSHLTAMTDEEYAEMVDAVERATNNSTAELRRWRSSALLRIGRLGINTIDNWDGINAFTMSPKISGKRFYDMTVAELQALVKKCEMIARAGGLRTRPREEETPADTPAVFDRPGVVVRIRPSEVAS
jgi:diadenosine tetraphosphate (Ap4A) HIT family hydrolase